MPKASHIGQPAEQHRLHGAPAGLLHVHEQHARRVRHDHRADVSVLSVDRTFLLGVGAMKAGTTWLHDYLAASPQCQPGVRKEYHVFDSLDLAKEPYLLHRVVAKAHASLDEVAQARPTDPTYLVQAAMIADEELYYDYFTALFARSARRPG